jgi:hypothetical protein
VDGLTLSSPWLERFEVLVFVASAYVFNTFNGINKIIKPGRWLIRVVASGLTKLQVITYQFVNADSVS